MLKATFWAWLLSQFVLVATVAATYPMLPDTVATHFGPNGKPDIWRSRPAYVTGLLLLSLAVAGAFVGAGFLDVRIRSARNSSLVVPNQERHWSQKHGREFREGVFAVALASAASVTGYVLALYLLTILSNLGRRPRIIEAAGAGAIGLASLIGWAAFCYIIGCRDRKLRATDADREASHPTKAQRGRFPWAGS